MIVLWEEQIWLEHNEEEDGDCLDAGGAPGYFNGLNIYIAQRYPIFDNTLWCTKHVHMHYFLIIMYDTKRTDGKVDLISLSNI